MKHTDTIRETFREDEEDEIAALRETNSIG
jgi:hypothetical protein